MRWPYFKHERQVLFPEFAASLLHFLDSFIRFGPGGWLLGLTLFIALSCHALGGPLGGSKTADSVFSHMENCINLDLNKLALSLIRIHIIGEESKFCTLC